jgi:hypothetical protein
MNSLSFIAVGAPRLEEITLYQTWSSRLGVCREASSLTQKKCVAEKAQPGNAGQIILGRQRQVKRMKKQQLDIGTWNVNTMLKSGKMQEIVDEIVGSQIQIMHYKKLDGRDMVY